MSMENLNSCKQKANLKKDLIEYYDQIKFAIDMKVQNLLVNIENSQTGIPDEKDYILKINFEMINIIEKIESFNMDQINLHFSNQYHDNLNNQEDLKFRILRNHCFYIKESELCNQLRKKCIIGILVTADWYLNEEEIEYIRYPIN